MYVSLCDFPCLVLLLPFGLGFYLFFGFFLPFLLSRVASRVLVHSGCQAGASEVGEWSAGYWTTRDFPAPCNISRREISQRYPSQH